MAIPLWAVLSILAAFLWAITNAVDKFVYSKWIKHQHVFAPALILAPISLITAFIIYFTQGFAQLSFIHLLLALFSGAVFAVLIILYIKAVQIEEVSRVIPLFYLAPAFTAIMAALFLSEVFAAIDYIGIALLMLGAILISTRSLKQISLGKAFWLMFLAALFWAISLVVTKYLLNFTDYWTIFAYARIGTFLSISPLFFFYFKDLVATLKEHGAKVVTVIGLSESLSLSATLSITIASAVGFVTLVNALAAVQPFFILAIAAALSIFYPKILKEDVDKKTIALKLIAITIIFIGAMIIT
ncbi:MAG TPA: EamA family transporter [Candidatus Nanoarchaeia archaeon]|nr:EamA family transporter [Candidatus Nanoarchaeia archaeon]